MESATGAGPELPSIREIQAEHLVCIARRDQDPILCDPREEIDPAILTIDGGCGNQIHGTAEHQIRASEFRSLHDTAVTKHPANAEIFCGDCHDAIIAQRADQQSLSE